MKFDEAADLFDAHVGIACPGAAIEVRRRGEVLFSRTAGFTAVDADEMREDGRVFTAVGRYATPVVPHAVRAPVTPDTLFDLASVTKPLSTALLTAVAFDRGELSPDARLGTFPGFEGFPKRAGLVVNDILLHRAGFQAWMPFAQRLIPEFGIGTAGSEYARGDCLSMALAGTPVGTPGVDILYSDVGYIVLGMLLERVAGCGLAGLFDDRVARPLCLRRTGFRPIVPATGAVETGGGEVAATAWCPLRARVMQGEVHDDNAWYLGGAAGHAGLFSTVHETADLVDAWLDAIAGRSQILGRDTAVPFVFDDTGLPGVQRTPGFDRPSPTGSNAGDLCPAGTVGHLGFTGTSIWFDRDSGVSIVLLTNRTNPGMYDRVPDIKAMRRAVHDAVWKAVLQ